MIMSNYPNIAILQNLSLDIDKLNLIIQNLLNDFKIFLNLEPIFIKIKFVIKKNSRDLYQDNDIFNIGVKRTFLNNCLIIEVHKFYTKFLHFIILREIYYCFVPKSLINYESVQLVVNQVILVDLSKFPFINEWRSLIRGQLEHYDHITVGVNRLYEFDRLEKFFKLKKSGTSYNPTQFFFSYLKKNFSIINDKKDDFYDVFHENFMQYVLKLMINDDIIETIRCITKIFYNVNNFRNLLNYRQVFRKFKENGKITTSLSLRKFVKNMNWIKNYTYIAPSYKLIWNTINICLIAIFLRFNPLLNKGKIYKIIETLPFFVSPKISRISFAVCLAGYVVIPKVYLDDFIKFLEKLEDFGYVITYKSLLITTMAHNMNLNYFREYSRKQRIINPNYRDYNNKYEIEARFDYGKEFYNKELDLLDFLILDRIRFYSTGGLGFERRDEMINTIKADLINEIISERAQIKNLKDILKKFHRSVDLKTEFLYFLENNKKFGFFYMKTVVEDLLMIFSLLNEKLINNPKFRNLIQFQRFIEEYFKPKLIEEYILLSNKKIIKIFFDKIISNYSESKDLYNDIINKYRKIFDLLNSCYNLKLFNLNSIKKLLLDQTLVDTIYKKKEEKLKNSFEKFKLYRVTSQEIDRIIEQFLKNIPPIIKPVLINTIIEGKYVKDYLQLVIVDSKETRLIIENLKIFFLRVLVYKTYDIRRNENLLYIEISTPYLTKKEKYELYSILYNNFKNNLIYGKSYFWSGHNPVLSRKNFYDFDKKQFFYTKDLFRQIFLHTQKIFGPQLKHIPNKINQYQEQFWLKEKELNNLVLKANDRVRQENINFNEKSLKKLSNFNLNIIKYLTDDEQFKKLKQEFFFTNYVKSIKFIPLFENFGLGLYFLYLYPIDMNEIDFKLLFLNTFQKIKYPSSIDSSNSLIIKYIKPYGSPNLKYLHWLARSKKIIREYCGFFINKVYKILHFNDNLSPEGWIFDKDKFKMHMQNILFNPKYNLENSIIKEFETGNKSISLFLGPESLEFESLSKIYGTQSIDIKSYLATKKVITINHIASLLKKNLIFPYLTLKNLDLHNKVYIIVPNLRKELIDTVVKVFSFFNVASIYEIKGEYFIYGFKQEIQFSTGLMIKISFPKCEISEFERLFDLLFEYLKVENYIILNDLVDGSNLVKSIYGGLEFLKSYNPLKNLEWNEHQKRWENPKVFTSKFEPIYPDLIAKDKQ